MSAMKIPEDEEQRNIIDKLANFVARNGPKFEELTKNKQQGNEKFAFLFGGDYHAYYKWKVGLETTQVNAQKQLQQHETQKTGDGSQPSDQQGPKVVVVKRPEFDLTEFRELLQKLVAACTKDNIQNGKNWIVTNCKTDSQLKTTMRILLRRMLEEVLPFQQKLHIVYLANDILHHSRKKNLPQLLENLQPFILPVVALAYNGERPENQAKLAKVVNIWETQKFFDDAIREIRSYDSNPVVPLNCGGPLKRGTFQDIDVKFQKLTSIESLYDSQLDLIDQEKTEVQLEIERREKEEEEERRRKEDEEKRKAEEVLRQQSQSRDYQYGHYEQNNQYAMQPPMGGQPDPYHYYASGQQPQQQPYQQPPGIYEPSYQPYQEVGQYCGHQPAVQTFDYSHQSLPIDASGQGGAVTFDYEHGNAPLPDGVPPMQEPIHDPTIPLAAYHDLPAGLMVPLVKLWDCEYRPLDPKDLRLPIPQPPSERLLAAIEAFYAPPSHDRPRDSQGWEKMGLFEFFKAKLKYIKEKERKLEVFERSPSPPPSRSSTPELDGSELVKDAPSRKSHSPSPLNTSGRQLRARSRSASRERRRSRSRSISRSPRRKRSRSRSYSRSRSRSRSRSKSPRRSPVRRSPTPPEAFQGFTETRSLDSRIEETNVGHQLLMKMGWGGQGLGKKESGIVDPIKQGEVRDRQDKFKEKDTSQDVDFKNQGVGVDMNDPFEQYRKNKSYTFGKRKGIRFTAK